MNKIKFSILYILVLTLFSTQFTMAQDSIFINMLKEELKGLEKKAVSLADEFPEDKYNWRPADGIRSVSETFIHVTSANYWIPSLVGQEFPASLKDAEKNITAKANVIKVLKESYANAAKFLDELKVGELEDIVETQYGNFSKGKLVLMLIGHSHEHIGQGIAYARSVGVVPPWSKK